MLNLKIYMSHVSLTLGQFKYLIQLQIGIEEILNLKICGIFIYPKTVFQGDSEEKTTNL